VAEELMATGREVIPISIEQMQHFVGNLLHVKVSRSTVQKVDAASCILLSGTAFHQLRPEQRQVLQRHGQLVPVDIPTIEAVGGGSVRCMLAEDFLPRR